MKTSTNMAIKAILGTIILHPECLDEARVRMKPADVYDFKLKTIYDAILMLSERGLAFDRPAIQSVLPSQDISSSDWNEIEASSSTKNFQDHLHIVKDASLKRQLASVCKQTNEDLATNPNVSSEVALSKINKAIGDICNNIATDENTTTYAEMMTDYLTKMKERVNTKSGMTGVSSGFGELDKMTAGLQPADLIIVAARPSMGKTTFAMNIVESVLGDGGRAMVFSMEMPADSLLQRSLASVGGINQSNLKTGRITDLEAGKLGAAAEKLSNYDIVMDDTAELTITELRLKALKAHREKPLKMIMVDYLQLMSGKDSGVGADNRTGEITHISRGLKMLAKDLGIPVIALSQLNRSLEKRADKRPINSDLRESGAIEQDADIIMFVYRDEVYNDESPDKGMAEIIIGKHRNGPIGMFPLKFEGQYSRFVDKTSIQKLEAPQQPETPPSNGYIPTNELSSPGELLF